MRATLLTLAVTGLLAFANPLPATRALPFTVDVTTPSQGTFVGTFKPLSNIDEFQGIPYAQPPVGPLRFHKTRPLDSFNGTRSAFLNGHICQQLPIRLDVAISEDCLNLNIFRPHGTNASSKLPVLAFYHGGAFQSGSNSDPSAKPAALVARSMTLGEPVVYVSVNYRLGAFGFLAGPQMDAADAAGTAVLNAGFHDQRESLRWIQSNIESFGGDASKVTIFGSSAGASGVAAQMLANGGQTENLFRGAIMQSGSAATGPRFPASGEVPTAAFNTILRETGCANLDCLRSAPAASILKANVVLTLISPTLIGFFPVLDRFFVTERPSTQFAAGRFSNIPFISGTNLDDGTSFAKTDLKDQSALSKSVADYFGTSSISSHAELMKLYPDDPAVGSPFEPELVGASPDDRFYGAGNEYKREAAILTDGSFNAGRRMQLQASFGRQGIKCWSYLFAQPSPFTILAVKAHGVDHASELPFVYASPPHSLSVPFTNNPAMTAYASNADLQRTSDILSAAWIHFAHRLDPSGRDVPEWTEYGEQKNSLRVQGLKTSLIKDTFRSEQTDFFMSSAKSFNL